ncbi:MAG: hypothetical protein HKP09_00800, partial [Enterobacterales bacterium]|nr:hypothetical protein [Enterobacterales bacterium]
MLKSLFARNGGAKNNNRLGISFDSEHVSVAYAEIDSSGVAIQRCHSEPLKEDYSASVKQALKQVGSPSCPANVALTLEDSTIHKVEKPKVPPEELDGSILFLLKDRLSHSVEDTMVATITYPKDCRHDDHMMAVEVHKSRITQIVDALHAAHVEINAIDLTELNLGDMLEDDDTMTKGLAILMEHSRGVSLLVYRNHELYLIRRINGISDLISCLPAPGNDQMAEMLMLEIQRTFDYYDSLMGQPLPARLYL